MKVIPSAMLFALATVLPSVPARAQQCPSGQFYRVSKKACIDRAEAVTLGIVKPAPRKAPAIPVAPAAAAPEPAPPEASVSPPPPDAAPAAKRVRAIKIPASPDLREAAEPAPPPPPEGAPAAPQPPPAAPAASPFGALNVENFAKP